MVQWKTTGGVCGNDSIREEYQTNFKRNDSNKSSINLISLFPFHEFGKFSLRSECETKAGILKSEREKKEEWISS